MLIKLNENKILILLSVISVLLFSSCDDKSIFGEMSSSNLSVVLKGTYSSNSTRPWQTPAYSVLEDDSVDDYLSLTGDTFPTKFRMDIAEMRIAKDSDLDRITDTNDDMLDTRFANYRQSFEFDMNETNDAFFNGTGVTYYKNDDVSPGEDYTYVLLYLRKMMFDQSKKYNATSGGWTLDTAEPFTTVFQKFLGDGEFASPEDVEAVDFNQFNVNTYYDNLLEGASSINRVFPVKIPIVGGYNFTSGSKAVIEIRFVIKNFIKRYEYDYLSGSTDGTNYILHYYGLSDWYRDVHAGESDMGGNLFAVARVYDPDNVGTITEGDAGDATVLADNGRYIVAIPEGDSLSNYALNGDYDSDGDGDSNERVDNDCDMPLAPLSPGEFIEPMLDYYLKYEKYKIDWNAKITAGCSSVDVYNSEWIAYEATKGNNKIPPYVVWTTSISYTIDNVPPGNYHVYESAAIKYQNGNEEYGTLPTSFPVDKGVITVTAN